MSTFNGLVDGFRARSGDVSFLDRLDDLRARLIASLLVVTVATGAGFWVAMTYDVLGIFTAPVEPFLAGEKLKYLSPTDPFFITLKLAICIGLALALPYLVSQLWRLLAPLMLPDERRLAVPGILGAVVLFAIGVVFCYYVVLPVMLRFTMGFQPESLEQWLVVDRYLKVVLRLLLAFGLAFELPIVILLGTVLGILTPQWLSSKRRHAVAAFTIGAAFVTPPDMSSMLLLLVPLILLYEVSILMCRLVVARRPALAESAEG